MFGKHTTRISTLFGAQVETNLEGVVVLAAAGLLGRTWFEGGLIFVGLALATGLHVMGHWLVALASGKGISRIVFTRAGGIEYSGAEAGLAEGVLRDAAGPAVNGICALAGYLVLARLDTSAWAPEGVAAVRIFAHCSLFLLALNLLPAIPLDGGSILRSMLAPRLGEGRAHVWAGRVSVVTLAAVAVVSLGYRVFALAYFAAAIAWDVWRERARGG